MKTQFVITQLNKLPAERGLELREHNAWLRCPFHGNGKEYTPSCKINLDLEEGYKVGSWVCFGCSKHGDWVELAKALNLKTGSKFGDDDIFNFYIPSSKKHQILGSDSEQTLDLPPEIRLSPDWDKQTKWRGIKGSLINKIHGKRYFDKWGEHLFLPCTINKQYVGGIKCAIEKSDDKRQLSYVYEPGQWIRSTVFPYDYTRKLLKRYNRRIILLGEGPRDSLNLLQYGMPALSNLGGPTVWTTAKADLIMSLDPDLLVIATDPDEVGDILYQAMMDVFALQVKTTRLKFPAYIKGKTEKKDPGNMKRSKIKELMQRLNLEKK